MNGILIIILKNTYTFSDLKHRLNILKSYIVQNLFGADQPIVQTQSETEGADLTWLKSLSPVFFQNFNKDNTYQLMSELENAINQLKTLVIYLAFETDNASLVSIGRYVRKTFSYIGQSSLGQNIPLILDIKFDPTLIAGTALSWNGIYKDFSVKSGIAEKRQLILDSFKKYLR